MRKITKESVNNFLNAKKYKNSNTEIIVLPNVTMFKLYETIIAYRYNDPERMLIIKTDGYNTNTTKERLNALPNVKISTKKGTFFLNGKEWDGSSIEVN
jgi:hypothetical protein